MNETLDVLTMMGKFSIAGMHHYLAILCLKPCNATMRLIIFSYRR